MAMKGSRLCFYLKLYFIFITTASVFSFQVHVSGFIQFSIFQGLDLVVYLSGFRYSFFFILQDLYLVLYPSGFRPSFLSFRVQIQFSILQGLYLVFYPSGFRCSFQSFRVQIQFFIPSGFRSSFLYLQGLDPGFIFITTALVFSFQVHVSRFRSSFLSLKVLIQLSILLGLFLVFYPSGF